MICVYINKIIDTIKTEAGYYRGSIDVFIPENEVQDVYLGLIELGYQCKLFVTKIHVYWDEKLPPAEALNLDYSPAKFLVEAWKFLALLNIKEINERSDMFKVFHLKKDGFYICYIWNYYNSKEELYYVIPGTQKENLLIENLKEA